MKGKIEKHKREYEIICKKSNGNICYMYILKEDMPEFMKDINKQWEEIKKKKMRNEER